MAVQTGYCTNYSQISEQFNRGFNQVALLSALRQYRLFTIPKIEQGLNALSDTVSGVDGLYSEFIADYNGNGQFAALVYADAKDAVVGLKNANQGLESSLAIGRLTNVEIINALDALQINCSENVGGAVNLLLGAVETMKDEISGEVLNQQTALDAYQSNLMSQLERLDSDIEEQTLTVETAADDFKRQKTAAVAGYVAMADNCETRSYALRIARGIYNGNMVLGFTNTTNQLFGSEAEMRDQPTVVGFCREGAESLLAFKNPDKADLGRYTADNGARTFNSIVSYKADGGSGVMAIEGQFAFNHLGSGLEPMCGSSYLAYSGRFSSAPVILN